MRPLLNTVVAFFYILLREEVEKTIPTIEINIQGGEREYSATVYEWMTLDEERKYQEILGFNTVEQGVKVDANPVKRALNELEKSAIKKDDDSITFTISVDQLNKAKDYTVKTMMKSPAFEEFNEWHPQARDALVSKLEELRDKKK